VTDGEPGERNRIVIFIDRKEYVAPSEEMTGTQIRGLVTPPIGQDRDLWLEVPGREDEKIRDDQLVKLRNEMHFFTAPATITPGLDACSC
jgi:hypothetical protein